MHGRICSEEPENFESSLGLGYEPEIPKPLDPDPVCVSELESRAQSAGRAISRADAEVAASAMKDGVGLITNDGELFRLLQSIGYAVEGW